jgi:hypothetical protein
VLGVVLVRNIVSMARRILDANLADLSERRGLGSAAAVVLSGHSAGGLATYLHGV